MRRATHILAFLVALTACSVGCKTMPGLKPKADTTGASIGTAAPAGTKSTSDAAAAGGNSAATSEPADAATASQATATQTAGQSTAGTSGAAADANPADASDNVASTTPAATAAGSTLRRQSPADSQAMLDALEELHVIGAINATTQRRMVADLKQTDPALWPQLLQYFRASALMHKKAGQKAQEQLAQDTPPSTPAEASIDNRSPAANATEPAVQLAQATTASAARVTGAMPVQATVAAQQPVDASQPQADPRQIPAAPATSVAATTASPPATSNIASSAGPAAATAAPPAAPSAGKTTAASSPQPAAEAEDPNAWEDHLQAAIAGLENVTRQSPQSAAETSQHAALRLLYMIAGRRDDALRPINGIAPGQQDFWSQEVYGLANYLDTERNPDSSRRAAEAVGRLREAADRLGEHATLAVKNLAFCTEVTSFGVYKPFTKDEYKAGQEVLLYAEIENYKSRRDEKGFHTALRSSYQILDPHGARVDSQEFEVTEEHCQNLRHDFFMRYHIWMPKRIYGGRYTLQLTIEDTLSQKIGQSSLEFTVKE